MRCVVWIDESPSLESTMSGSHKTATLGDAVHLAMLFRDS
jgi:hypothetical protein